MPYLKPILLGEFQPQLFATLFPGQQVPNVRGGTAVVNLVRAHLEQGLPVDVLTLDPQAAEPLVRLKSDRLNIWIVKRRPSKAVRDGFLQERKLIEVVLKESDAGICHAHWTYEYGMAAVTQKIKPFIVTVHDHSRHILLWQGWRYAGLYLLTQYVLRKAAGRLTAVSPYIADYAAKVSGAPVPVIPNVVLSEWRVASGEWRVVEDRGQKSEVSGHQSSVISPPRSYPTLITLADWGRLKNIKRALRAFKLFRTKMPNAQYRLIGAGLEQDGPAHCWAVKKGLDDGVRFCGWMPYDRAMELLHSSTVLFHPSLEESFGYPVAEALAAGIPVVAAQQARGAAWLLAEGQYGILADGRSNKALADAICATFNRSVAAELAVAGREHIQTLCNGAAVLAQYQNIYNTGLRRI
jgi:glycosyltransferase involved in cell wall biosynthesis